MEREDWLWLAFWAGFAVLDLYADHHGKSLCTSVRRRARTDTAAGRVRLSLAVDVGALVLKRHLLKPEIPGGPDALARIAARIR